MKHTPAVLTVAASLALATGALGQTPLPARPSGAGPLEGDWAGQIYTGALKLRIVLHVHTRDGQINATLDSPDQNAAGLPASVTVVAGHVHITAAGAAGAFEGEIGADGSSLKGQWSGAPTTMARLAHGQSIAAPRRPQTPTKPYPYREESVMYRDAAGPHLAGTLTLPEGNGPFPAVVLIAGSGPNGRDEQVFGHSLFLVLADHLTRQRIAVLRYDKRGIGQSTGNYASATSTDFADDADAGVTYLRGRPEIDPRHIGLIGHSEGGLIAPMVAARDHMIAFMVLMAAPGVRGDQIIMAQARAIAGANGAPEAAVDAGQALERRFLDALMAAHDEASAEAAARTVLKGAGLPDATADAQAKAGSSPWYRFFLSYDPVPALRGLRIPVLALIGSKDLQVPGGQNLPALRAALTDDPHAEVVELDGLNHLFQDAGSGAPSEYGQIEETMSPTAMDRIAHWILAEGAPAQ